MNLQEMEFIQDDCLWQVVTRGLVMADCGLVIKVMEVARAGAGVHSNTAKPGVSKI